VRGRPSARSEIAKGRQSLTRNFGRAESLLER
jgi:hypothetical protein